ncbi:MAG: hypothetical protein JRE40_16260 [Deltaproteobacteria bacterium]|nr:hypothetical protein [Deltaproteobacteria bacterium]
MNNPIIKKDGKWYNTKTKHFLSESYGKRLHSYYRRFPDALLKEARGHKEHVRPDCYTENGGLEGQNLRIWGRRELERLGVL